ncbi:hypothetical protein M409DRAFT_70948 [Zasmidium cellare ATCC 36951]|uniref:NAD(P)-binding domain-containing protein n=1 Tax=Zasmidium cellare ATCC 36951 TaxID=1080233 RepID=A0A6A6BY19_ZASCE|nr:uncharacterized protein M409DRAFT_70948 [Zasmidium cellare ATCC 36951]KAF2159493.1 hypothetical protein M409DRAFT_70948 [Zasmidium cellare ATCC 36951]
MQINDSALPLGSVVVVIGANGHIAAETCEKLLQAGFRVRGTVRDVHRQAWMGKLFDPQWPGMFELVKVEDFGRDGAFDTAFEGAAGVIYASPPVQFSAEPAKSIAPIIQTITNTLSAASSQSSIKRFVLVSSSMAVQNVIHDQPRRLTRQMFNDAAIIRSLCQADADPLSVYSAGRTLAELSFWTWVEEHNPKFIANVVVPDANFGRLLNPDTDTGLATSIMGMLKRAAAGELHAVNPISHVVDVQDTARLLVAAVALPDVQGERVFAYHRIENWASLRAKIRAHRSDVVVGEDRANEGIDLADASAAIARSDELLRRLGRPGFTSVDQMLGDFVASCY